MIRAYGIPALVLIVGMIFFITMSSTTALTQSTLSMSSAEVRGRFQHRLLQPVLSFAESWFARTDRIVFHDPLAAVCLFHPEVCIWQAGMVDCDLLPRHAGRTIWRPGAAPQRHLVGFEVDATAFFAHYFSPFDRG